MSDNLVTTFCGLTAEEIKQLQHERDELKGHCVFLVQELSDLSAQNACHCGHPHCNRCEDTKSAEEMINSTPTQSLAEIQAQAVDNLLEGYSDYLENALAHGVFSMTISQYVQQLRNK